MLHTYNEKRIVQLNIKEKQLSRFIQSMCSLYAHSRWRWSLKFRNVNKFKWNEESKLVAKQTSIYLVKVKLISVATKPVQPVTTSKRIPTVIYQVLSTCRSQIKKNWKYQKISNTYIICSIYVNVIVTLIIWIRLYTCNNLYAIIFCK